MAWWSKPSGPYLTGSLDWQDNVYELQFAFEEYGYAIEAIAGIGGSVSAESGFNPWRWEGDIVNYNFGYGLFQFTPASGYIRGAVEIEGYGPNLSVSEETQGATDTDGSAQCYVVIHDVLGKWNNTCWRTYWDKNKYNQLWRKANNIIAEYGSNGKLSIEEFKLITSVYDATFAFMACYEGPSIPNIDRRYNYASKVYELLTGIKPPEPPKPVKKMPIYFYLRKF